MTYGYVCEQLWRERKDKPSDLAYSVSTITQLWFAGMWYSIERCHRNQRLHIYRRVNVFCTSSSSIWVNRA